MPSIPTLGGTGFVDEISSYYSYLRRYFPTLFELPFEAEPGSCSRGGSGDRAPLGSRRIEETSDVGTGRFCAARLEKIPATSRRVA